MKTTTSPITNAPDHTGVINEHYPRVAFCSAITPATPEHYDRMIDAGIDTACICLHASGLTHYKYATMHTTLARNAGMKTHAFLLTDLYDILADVTFFTKRFIQLGYTSRSKITILVNGDEYVDRREEKIIKIMDLLSKYHRRENIDLAFFKRDVDDKLYDLDKLPKLINLTIIRLEKATAGIDEAGTWIYTSYFPSKDEDEDIIQLLAYDFYGFYTDHKGYQMSLIDSDYVVQLGDTWHSISKRNGIPMNDLLTLNNAQSTDPIYAGQVIRIA